MQGDPNVRRAIAYLQSQLGEFGPLPKVGKWVRRRFADGPGFDFEAESSEPSLPAATYLPAVCGGHLPAG